MNTATFNPHEHLLNLGTAKKPRWYLEVKHRLHWFREACPEGTIETEILHMDLDREVTAEVTEWDEMQGRSVKKTKQGKGLVIFKATVTDGKGGKASGTKMENAASFGDFLEKAETGAIGRALAGLGYGTQFTGDELDEGQRIVDSPVDHKQKDPTAPTEQQLKSIQNLQKLLGLAVMPSAEGLSYADCAQLIKDYSQQWNAKKQQKAS